MTISIWELVIYLIIGFITWFVFSFIKHWRSQSRFIKDDKVFVTVKNSDSTVRTIFSAVSHSDILDTRDSKTKNALALYLVGICDYVARVNNLDDRQFFALFKAYSVNFNNYFDESTADEALIFFALPEARNSQAFEFVKLGGQTSAQLLGKKNAMALVVVAKLFFDLLNVAQDSQSLSGAKKSNSSDQLDLIAKLHDMKEKGIISEEEFQQKKSSLLQD